MAFDDDDDQSPAVDFDSDPEVSDADRSKSGGLDDFGAPDGSATGDFGEAAQPQAQPEAQGFGGSLIKNLLSFGRQLSGIGGSSDPHQQEIDQAQGSVRDMLSNELGQGDHWAGPEDPNTWEGLPESENIEDRRGETTGPQQTTMQKIDRLGRVGRNFAAGGLVEEEEDTDPQSAAVDFGGADPAQAAPAADDSQAPIGAAPTGQDQQQHLMPDDDQGPLTKFKNAVNTLPRPGEAGPGGGQPGLGARVQSGVQSFMRYLQGADASPSEQITQLERQVDPQGALDDDTRKMKVLEAAHQQGGEQAAWGALQHYRQKYDRYRGFAAAALKAGNIAAATKAATQSYSNLMDGNTVLFTPSADGGVLASVSKPRNNRLNTLSKTMDVSSTVALSPQQFQEWLTGMPGQYDNAIENGAPKVLAQLAQGQNNQAPAPSPSQSVTGNPAGPGTSATAPPPRKFIPTAQRDDGATAAPTSELPPQGGDARPFAAKGVGQPGQYRELPSNYKSPKTPAQEFPDDPKAKAMAERLHPGDQQAQAGSVYAQGQQKEKNAIDMAKAQQEFRVSAARERSAGQVGAATVRADATKTNAAMRAKALVQTALVKAVQSAQSSHERNVAQTAQAVIKSMPFGLDVNKMNEELTKAGLDVNAVKKMPGINEALQQLTQSQSDGEEAAAAPAPQAPAAPTKVQQPQQKFQPPPDWQYSASRKQYRDKKGVVYDVNGKRVQ